MTSQLQAGPKTEAAADGARTARPARQRLTALLVLLVLLVVGAASAWSLRPPQPRSASAPAKEFSAARATTLLGPIASVPHPAGSPAAAAVRAYLVEQLRGLGLQPEVQTRVAARSPAGGRPSVATVSNVHARVAGSRPTGRVLLVAHYDSVPTGPGATDDGANVAAILEVVRALRTGPAPRNDVDILFTDAEEAGLLGARAFVDSGAAGDPRRVVVVNLEARGVSGPAVMFQMAGTGLTPAVRAAGPVTTSFAAAVYQLLPNDTDLTAFAAGGMRGLNFAVVEGSAHYHTPHDDLAHVDAGSVQDMGQAALGAVRYLAAADLAAGGGSDDTYFSLFGTVISYPGWLTLPLAVAALAGYLLLLWTGRRRGLRPRGAVRGAGTFAAVVPAVAVIGIGGWWLLTLLRPDFQVGLGGLYRAGPYALAEAAVLLAVLVGWYRWARRKASPEEVAAGVLGWFVLFAVVFAVLLPGGAYLFIWPAILGVAALAAAVRLTPAGSPVRALAGAAAALPGMALVLPIALLLLPALGLGLSVAPLLLAALVAAAMAGVAEPLPRGRLLTAGMVVLLLAAVSTAGIGVALDRYDPHRPRGVSLAYVLSADTSTASWMSAGGPEQPQVGRLLTAGPGRVGERVPPLARWNPTSGPAPVVAVPGPQTVTSAADERDGVRTVRVRIRVPDDTYLIDVYADTSTQAILGATVDGAALAGGRNVSTPSGPWRWGFRYAAPPRGGIEVTLRARGAGPVRIRVVSTVPGLPDGVGAPVLRPDVSWTGWPAVPAQTLVVRTFQL